MKKMIIVAALALAGCASEAEKAEEEYRLVEKHSISAAERCAAARKVQQAYLAEDNEWEYRVWSSIANSCR